MNKNSFYLNFVNKEIREMVGLSTHGLTNTNQLQVTIPDEWKGVALQIIILPVGKGDEQIEFFTDAELQLLPGINLGTAIEDRENYSEW